MRLIAVSDIFGKTDKFEELVSTISTHFNTICLVDPYGGEKISFANEAAAYSHFIKHIGLEKYTELTRKVIKQQKKRTLLLGFSVGAAAIWDISQEPPLSPETQAIGFYGSQIRNKTYITPRIMIDLFFPIKENNFNVAGLIASLAEKQKVTCFHTNYHHGFMNKLSNNYHGKGYNQYLKIIEGYCSNFTTKHLNRTTTQEEQ